VRELGLLRLPSQVLFGHGVVRNAGAVARSYGARALVCTDPEMAASAQFDRLLASLRDHGMTVEVMPLALPEVPLAGVRDAVPPARRYRPDCIVAYGGGSSIDFGKLIALGVAHDPDVAECYGENAVPGEVTPVIAIPTTAGTGSEVTPVAVLADPDRALKVGLSSPYLVPRAAICDPELTHTCPPAVTAHSGIDALAHAIEAYTARRRDLEDVGDRVFIGKNVLSDGLAVAAIRLIGANLRRAVAGDETARAPMSQGSLLAGMAFGTAGTAAAHALQYAVGARSKSPHGLGTGLLLPYVMAASLPARRRELAACAEALGLDPGADEHQSALAAVQRVRDLGRDIGLPSSLSELDIDESDLDELADLSVSVTRLLDNSAVALDRAGVLSILAAAWAGAPPTTLAPEVVVA
jgi:alcohol dehydrogenase class IV